MVKPVIGITCNHVETGALFSLARSYVKAVERAGGIPFLLPLYSKPWCLGQVSELIDGLMLSGGNDLEPRFFGEEPIPGVGKIDPERDELEIALVRRCLRKSIPLLAICRGVQVLAVASGGDIYQDLTSQYPASLVKHNQRAPRWHPTHTVSAARGTLLASLVGLEPVYVNSFHHQAVRKIPKNFIVAACSQDGVVEAIEQRLPGSFALGVQWHPECLWPSDRRQLNIFQRLVTEAQKLRQERKKENPDRVGK